MHPPIIKDFASYINPLNGQSTPFKNVETVAGYCYRRIDGPPAIKPAHGLPVGEGQEHHRRGMDFVIRHTPDDKRDKNGLVYMGAAGFINLGYIAKSRAGAAILFDINPTQRLLWGTVLDALRKSDTREEFLTAFRRLPFTLEENIKALNAQAGFSVHPILDDVNAVNVIRNCYKELTSFPDGRPGCRSDFDLDDFGLENESDFWHLKALAEQNAIGVLTMDIKDPFARIYLQRALVQVTGRGQVDVLYLSNILPYIARDGATEDFSGVANHNGAQSYASMLNNIVALTHHGSLVVTYREFINSHPAIPAMLAHARQATYIPSEESESWDKRHNERGREPA
ncbi:MAG: hypothetical protein CMH32_06710 [Micavibrio sp.]|nr:hypothetical protein [Micavibrio sp.]